MSICNAESTRHKGGLRVAFCGFLYSAATVCGCHGMTALQGGVVGLSYYGSRVFVGEPAGVLP